MKKFLGCLLVFALRLSAEAPCCGAHQPGEDSKGHVHCAPPLYVKQWYPERHSKQSWPPMPH